MTLNVVLKPAESLEAFNEKLKSERAVLNAKLREHFKNQKYGIIPREPPRNPPCGAPQVL
jgi:hypothetical protein